MMAPSRPRVMTLRFVVVVVVLNLKNQNWLQIRPEQIHRVRELNQVWHLNGGLKKLRRGYKAFYYRCANQAKTGCTATVSIRFSEGGSKRTIVPLKQVHNHEHPAPSEKLDEGVRERAREYLQTSPPAK